VFHTNAVNYLRRERRQTLVDRIAAAATRRPLLWLSAEGSWIVPGLPDPGDMGNRAAVPLWLTDLRKREPVHHLLAIAGVQGAWLEWRHP